MNERDFPEAQMLYRGIEDDVAALDALASLSFVPSKALQSLDDVSVRQFLAAGLHDRIKARRNRLAELGMMLNQSHPGI